VKIEFFFEFDTHSRTGGHVYKWKKYLNENFQQKNNKYKEQLGQANRYGFLAQPFQTELGSSCKFSAMQYRGPQSVGVENL